MKSFSTDERLKLIFGEPKIDPEYPEASPYPGCSHWLASRGAVASPAAGYVFFGLGLVSGGGTTNGVGSFSDSKGCDYEDEHYGFRPVVSIPKSMIRRREGFSNIR